MSIASAGALRRFVEEDRARAFCFFAAGLVSEGHFLGHPMRNSFREDFQMWRRLAGIPEGQTEESMNAAAGKPLGGLLDVTSKVIHRHRRAAVAVAHALEVAPGMTLSYDQVREIAARTVARANEA